MKIGENDVQILDAIIDIIVQCDHQIWLGSNEELKKLINTKNSKDAELEFSRLASILELYDVAKIHSSKYNYDAIERNQNTRFFKDNGGFKKVFQDELIKIQKASEKEQIEFELAKSTIDAHKLNQENSKFNKTTSIIVIVVGLINLAVFIYQVFVFKK
ncbi:MAG: hypothetical protein VB102_14300 [Paludibacter sp.]|nr:hypothetical protein [Paludibacter sp.]